MKWILVFTGSGIGGCLRLWIGELTYNWLNTTFPYGTLIANFLASLILGLVAGLAGTHWLDEKTRIFLTIGLCGGFSTFSSFSNETLQMFSNQKIMEGLAYVAISVISCICAVYLGAVLVKWFN